MSLKRVVFSSGGAPVVVGYSSRWAAVLDALFSDYRIPLRPGPFDLELCERPDGTIVVADGEEPRRFLEEAEAATHFELTLAQMLADRMIRPLLHAGGVVSESGALLLPGDSGSGKSSLTAGLARTGFPVLGDDAVSLVTELPGVGPFKRLLKVHPGARRTLGLGPGESALAALWAEATFYHPHTLGSTWAGAAPVQFVVFPERLQGATTSLLPMRPGPGVRRLMELVLQGGGTPAQAFDALARVTEHSRFYRLRFGDSRQALRHLQRDLAIAPQAPE